MKLPSSLPCQRDWVLHRILIFVIATILSAGIPALEQRSTLFQSGGQETGVPAVEVGILLGREGAAFGPQVLLQGNLGFLGLYGFAGRSSVSGYTSGDGIRADFSDRVLGFGIACRLLRISRFTLGAFSQAAYYGSHVKASYRDGSGVSTVYRESERNPLVTLGAEVDYRVMHGITIFFPPGKDFGKNFAATTAGGFSFNGGRRVSILIIAKGVGKIFH
jgi:hypothetical protein